MRASVNSALASRVFPEAVNRHIEDITAIVFRRKRKQLMPLREVSFFAGSTSLTQPQPPRQPLNPDGRIKLTF